MTLYYHPKEQVLVGIVMLGFAAMFGGATFVTALDLPDPMAMLVTPIFGVIAFVFVLFAIASFVAGWHRRKNPAWLMRLTPQTVHINPIHPGYLHHLRQDATSMTLPVEAVDWIRRATKQRRTSEDVDEEFVEIRVDDETFHSTLENRSEITNQIRNGNAYESEKIVRMFEGNVLRIFIEGGRWPEGFDAFCASHSYPMLAPSMIAEPVDLATAKSQPRELF